MAVYSSVNAPAAPPILAVDLNGGGQNQLRPNQTGFTAWSANAPFTTLPTSGNGAAPDPDGGYPTATISNTFPGTGVTSTLRSVDVTTSGSPAYVNDDPRLNSRDQGSPADGGGLTTGNLLRDFVIAEIGTTTSAVHNGTNHRMEIQLDGLDANKTYKVTFYSYNHFNNKGGAVFTDVTDNPLVFLRAANATGTGGIFTPGDGTGSTQYAPDGQYMYSDGGVPVSDTERAVTLVATTDATGKLIFTQTTIVGLSGASETLPVLNGYVIDEFLKPAWSATSPGNWTAGANWSTGVAPNGLGQAADLISNAARTVTVDAPVTVGRLTLGGTGGFTINGSSTLRIDDPSASSVATFNSGRGRAAINVTGGSHTISAPVQLDNDTTVNLPFGTTLTLSNLQPSAMQLIKSDIGTLQVNNLRVDRLQNWSHIVRVLPNGIDGGAGGVSKLRTIDLGNGGPDGTATGQLDITNNKVITQDAAGTWNGTRYTGVTGHVQSGRGDGSWNGNGIITSMTDATVTGRTTIAVASGAEIRGLGPTDTDIWAGQTINGDSTLVMYTWGGDADMNGELNGDDYFFIDSNILTQNPGFHNGDFDYNGEINGDDYFVIDSNITFAQNSGIVFFTAGGGGGATLTAVPEPASAATLFIGAVAALCRRRRRGDI
jgi:hypothetical protein